MSTNIGRRRRRRISGVSGGGALARRRRRRMSGVGAALPTLVGSLGRRAKRPKCPFGTKKVRGRIVCRKTKRRRKSRR